MRVVRTAGLQMRGVVEALDAIGWLSAQACQRSVADPLGQRCAGRSLQPGEHFEYTSGTALQTQQGSMVGEYFCVAEDGHRFEVPIPEFVLSLPHALH